ncbi:MAG: Sb-PDE family phosphodiesterase [Saprospiraceae bacterium]|nr:Sb-PDE family phosphodiesterase [Saprospiraceae bacterium]
MRIALQLLILSCCCLTGWSQEAHTHVHGREIVFPDIEGYRTLKCDFHIHTVFSDGYVWPTIRVEEAVKDGLDAIALTEHIEYQPWSDDISHPDRNRSFEIATELATAFDLIVVHGAEITRDLPPGHANAIFITDANKLVLEDSIEAYREAKRQGGFIFWNHPNWIRQQPDGKATLSELHKMLLAEDLLDGIEVVNDITYSDEALQIALEQQITIMGTSDIHNLVDWKFDIANGGHRPITLVFARERNSEAIKDALIARRTVVWYRNLLVGETTFLKPLVEASIRVKDVSYEGPSSVALVQLENVSDATFLLRNQGAFNFHTTADVISLPAHERTQIQVKTGEQMESFRLYFEVLNAIVAPSKHLDFSLQIDVPKH